LEADVWLETQAGHYSLIRPDKQMVTEPEKLFFSDPVIVFKRGGVRLSLSRSGPPAKARK
jgi:hypothetical protein